MCSPRRSPFLAGRATGTMPLLACAASVAVARPAMAQNFQGLGLPPNGGYSHALGVSADGSTVVGAATVAGAEVAFVWRRGAGMQSLGTLTGGTYSHAVGVSADGSVVAGYGDSSAGVRAFRWTQAAGLQALPPQAGGTDSHAGGISADGAVIVGYAGASGASRACTWTGAAAPLVLGALPGGTSSFGNGISGDGSVVVGWSSSSTGNHAFRWTAAAGMIDLGAAPWGGTFSNLYRANSNGTVGSGVAGSSTSDYRSLRWTNAGGMVNLGILPGHTASYGEALSADGSVVVGDCGHSSGSVWISTAYIWTSSRGMVDLNTYLPTLGINLAGWTLTTAMAVSPDGLSIAGWGSHAGHEEAWVADIGRRCGSADFNCDGDVGTDADIESFFACLAGNCPAPPCTSDADFNGDGDVGTDADIEAFFRVLAGGTC